MFEENKLLKLDDIKLEQLKLVFLFKNGDLPNELNTFKLNVNSYNTRNASKGGLSISKINTTSFGSRSLSYSASVTWNECIKSVKDFNVIVIVIFVVIVIVIVIIFIDILFECNYYYLFIIYFCYCFINTFLYLKLDLADSLNSHIGLTAFV